MRSVCFDMLIFLIAVDIIFTHYSFGNSNTIIISFKGQILVLSFMIVFNRAYQGLSMNITISRGSNLLILWSNSVCFGL